MGTISVTLPSDGDTIDAADVNNPFNTIVTAINGNLDSNNITAGGLTPASLTSGTGTSWAWQSWTPTWANASVGNGTVTAKYIQIGKTVYARLSFVLGSSSTVGTSPTFTLPVTAATYTGLQKTNIGHLTEEDSSAGPAQALGVVRIESTTTAQPITYKVSTTYIAYEAITATAPFTWATGDGIYCTFAYEAA